MYKLFVGFRKLGEFDSIYLAKQFAQESGITGAFNLIDTNGYRDSWYIFPARREDSDKEIKPEISIEKESIIESCI